MLKNFCVRTKLFVLLIFPVGALMAMAASSALDKYGEMQDMDTAATVVALSVAGGNTIHELQKERGFSAGYLGSKGTAFASEVNNQRSETAKAREALEAGIGIFAAEHPNSPLNASFRSLMQKFDSLTALRSRISALSVTPGEAIAEYTVVVKELQNILDGILQYSEGAAMYAQSANLLDLVAAKEFAGQERAMLNAALSAGTFNKGLYRSWVERIALQNEYLAPVLGRASAGVNTLYSREVSPRLGTVEAFRQRAFDALDKPRLEDAPKAWFSASTEYINALHRVEQAMSGELESLAKSMADAARKDFYTGIAVALVGLAFTLLLAWRIVRDITVPLALSVNFAQRVAANELDAELVMERQDEFGTLAQALVSMLDAIKQMIGKADEATKSALEEADKATVAMSEAQEARRQAELARRDGMIAAAGRIDTAVTALSTVSQDISAQLALSDKGAREQSDRLAVAAAAMDQMNSTVMEVAENSSSASEIAGKAGEQAQKGAEKVADVSSHVAEVLASVENLKEAMARLGVRVQSIDTVLNVISDIADQTNLLALNAAIEAARAGEAGRGFAVVADEVRKLAEKTMHATKEVADVLSGIQRDTGDNIGTVDATLSAITTTSELARESGEALEAIVQLSNATRDQIHSIAAASAEQSAAGEEINAGVTSVNRIAEETVAAMEQSTHSMDELLEQAKVLERLVVELRDE